MVDLHGQYLKIKNEIDEAIQNVIDSTTFINGPQVKQLNVGLADYLECNHAISCANGTDALQIALMALDLQPGDEVIIPDFTFTATAEVTALLRLKPVFIDVTPDSFVMDIEKFKKAITKRTKAVIPVHLYGQCADMEQIMDIAVKNGIFVIEDNAQAFGADIKINDSWKKAGTVGHIGCTSFFPSKNLGCYGDGGALFTNDDKLASSIACIANHGAKIKYHNDRIGVNSRLDTIQAAVLLIKLKKINEYINSRQKAAKFYDTLFQDNDKINTPVRVDYSTHVFHQYTIVVDKRDELQKYLALKNIPTQIYYPVGMHNQIAYKASGDFEVSDYLCKSVISLPMHTELSESQQECIVNSINEFYKK